MTWRLMFGETVRCGVGRTLRSHGAGRTRRPLALFMAVALAAGLFTLEFSPSVGATSIVYFAAPTAQGNGDCTTVNTACTLSTALSTTGAGGIIELTSSGPYVGGFTVSTTGTTSNTPVTIEPAPGVTNPALSGGGSQTVLTISTSAFVTISGITVEDGSSGGGTAGVSVSGGGTLTVTNCTLTNNHGNNGGALGVGATGSSQTGTANVAGSTFTNNSANWGGAIAVGDGSGSTSGTGNTGTLTVDSSTFQGNTSYNYAGGAIADGLFGASGTSTITNSTFVGNSASDEGGAIENGYYSTLRGNTGHAILVVSGSTFDSNSSPYGIGGAINNAGSNSGLGTATVTTSTFTNNYGNIGGGAIENAFGSGSVGTLTVTASTFTGDTAHNGGQPAIVNGGGGTPGSATTTVADDLFAESCSRSTGTWTDDGYNVAVDSTCVNGGTADNQSNSGLGSLVEPLGANGGPTQTMALIPPNPAIGIIPSATSGQCPVPDQRGVTPPSGAACDAGAVQLAAQTISFTSTAPSASIGTGPYHPTATSSSGLTPIVSLDGASTGCTLSGGAVTFTSVGTCIVDANQSGTTVIQAAPVASQSIPVTAAVPGAPTGLTASPAPSGITLAWTPPAFDGGAPVSGYQVLRGTSAGAEGPAPLATVSGTSVVDSSAVPGTPYFYVVEALNSSGSSPASAEVSSVITTAPGNVSTGGGVASTPDGRGYWIASPDGSISTHGDAPNDGSPAESGLTLNKPVVGMASSPAGGYWFVASDGGVFAYGKAQFYGSQASEHLNSPVVGISPTSDGKGYWLVGADGGVFTFGDAHFCGSMGGTYLNRAVVGITPTPDGKDYWLVGADGGVFTFGDAHFYGSMGNRHLNSPVIGITATPDGKGYWLVAADGGVFTFGDAPFYGSTAGSAHAGAVALIASPDGKGYSIIDQAGDATTFGT